jgi:hypothetical protein
MTLKALVLLVGLAFLSPPADDFQRERGGAGDRASASDRAKDAAEGKAPPELKSEKWLNTPGDKPLAWKDLRGKVVLVDLWAYW